MQPKRSNAWPTASDLVASRHIELEDESLGRVMFDEVAAGLGRPIGDYRQLTAGQNGFGERPSQAGRRAGDEPDAVVCRGAVVLSHPLFGLSTSGRERAPPIGRICGRTYGGCRLPRTGEALG